MRPVKKLRLVVLIDNITDGLLPPSPPHVRRNGFVGSSGTRLNLTEPPLRAEHGFACYLEVETDDRQVALLFDFGLSADTLINNARLLGIDPEAVAALVLSHGHFDHAGGLMGTVRTWLRGRHLPLYVGTEAFNRRYLALPDGRLVDMGRLVPEEISAAGAEICELEGSKEILPGVYALASIPRRTAFETGAPVLKVERAGRVEPDLLPGEVSLAFLLEGKGLVVLTACAHAGVINTVELAREQAGGAPVYAVIGGFHLSGAPSEKIKATIEALTALRPFLLAPLHCSGFDFAREAAAALPEAFVYNAVGTEYVF